MAGGAKRRARMACEEETTYWQFLPYLMPDGAIVHAAAAIKKVVSVPVIAVGKIWDPRMASRELMERGSPADACGTICLSFRSLGKLSLKIWSTNRETNHLF